MLTIYYKKFFQYSGFRGPGSGPGSGPGPGPVIPYSSVPWRTAVYGVLSSSDSRTCWSHQCAAAPRDIRHWLLRTPAQLALVGGGGGRRDEIEWPHGVAF